MDNKISGFTYNARVRPEVRDYSPNLLVELGFCQSESIFAEGHGILFTLVNFTLGVGKLCCVQHHGDTM